MKTCPKCKRPRGDALNRDPGPWFRCEADIGDEIDAAYCEQVAAAYRAGVLRGVEIARTAAKLEWHREDTAEIDWSDVDRAVRGEVGE